MKKVLLITLGIVACTLMQAQSLQLRLSSHTMNQPVVNSIIREYVYPSTISYVEMV